MKSAKKEERAHPRREKVSSIPPNIRSRDQETASEFKARLGYKVSLRSD